MVLRSLFTGFFIITSLYLLLTYQFGITLGAPGRSRDNRRPGNRGFGQYPRPSQYVQMKNEPFVNDFIESIAEFVLVETLRQTLFSGGSAVVWGCGIIFCLAFADTLLLYRKFSFNAKWYCNFSSPFDDDDIFELSKRQQSNSDDYGHMRFGRKGEEISDDYGHMRFGRSNTKKK